MKNSKGFSLVELIVAVAIIGILASLVVPAYKRYSTKARQSEAKVNLGGIFTSEKSFYAEYMAYHTSFLAIGYSPEGLLRYNIGFSNTPAAYTSVAGPANGYNTTLTLPELSFTSTLDYCSGLGDAVTAPWPGAPGNQCQILSSSPNLITGSTIPSALADSFTTYGNGFSAGAIINLDKDVFVQSDSTKNDPTSFVSNMHMSEPTFGLLSFSAQFVVGLLADVANASNLTSDVYTDTFSIDATGNFQNLRCRAFERPYPKTIYVWDGTTWNQQFVAGVQSIGAKSTPYDSSGGAVVMVQTMYGDGTSSQRLNGEVATTVLSCTGGVR